jgi:hypothetical protein
MKPPQIGYGQAHFDRGATHFARDAHAAAECLHEQVVGRVVPPEAAGAEAADSAVDQPRVDGGQRGVIQAGPGERAEAVVVD